MVDTTTEVETPPPDPPRVSELPRSTAVAEQSGSSADTRAGSHETAAAAARSEYAEAQAMLAQNGEQPSAARTTPPEQTTPPGQTTADTTAGSLDQTGVPDAASETGTTRVDQPALPVTSTAVEYGRPVDAATGTPAPLFDGPPTRDQAVQGALGDCGVISTIGAVAGSRPESIQNAIHANEDGTYSVTLHDAKFTSPDRTEATGEKIQMVVTPDVPVMSGDTGTSAFADQSENGTAWASVMEKAVAGVDQTWDSASQGTASATGYARLDQGTTAGDRAELLTQITGEPAVVRHFDQSPGSEGSAEQQIRDSLDAGKPVLVGTIQTAPGDRLPHGLISGHAYEVTSLDNGMVQLHNPWGQNQPGAMSIRDFLDSTGRNYTTLE